MRKLVGQVILLHRYLGIVFCLFFATWFASGFVMLFARMPELTDADRLAHLRPIEPATLKVTPAHAFARTNLRRAPERITISMVGQRPAYHFLPASGTWVTVFADDGSLLHGVDENSSVRIAAEFDQRPGERFVWMEELKDVDQWTLYPEPPSRPYLPFQRVKAGDGKGTQYYVSEATGSVFMRTTNRSRLLAWCGAIPHWWYIRALRANTPLWRAVMILVSAWGIVMSAAGILTGILRFSPSRRYRFPGPRYSFIPYAGWKRWHNILGGFFGVFVFTWILSGLFTVNPGYWSPGPDPTSEQARAFAGASLDPAAFSLEPAQGIALPASCIRPVELELIIFQGRPFYLAKNAQSQEQLLPAGGPSAKCISTLPTHDLVEAAQRVVGGAPAVDSTLLNQFDTYYYTDLTFQRPLPILRVRFADAHQTWLYVNPRTGLIEAIYADRTRLGRWLYEGLHDFDYPMLYRHRLAWYVIVIILVAGGLVLSLTGVTLGVRFMQRTFRKKIRIHIT